MCQHHWRTGYAGEKFWQSSGHHTEPKYSVVFRFSREVNTAVDGTWLCGRCSLWKNYSEDCFFQQQDRGLLVLGLAHTLLGLTPHGFHHQSELFRGATILGWQARLPHEKNQRDKAIRGNFTCMGLTSNRYTSLHRANV